MYVYMYIYVYTLWGSCRATLLVARDSLAARKSDELRLIPVSVGKALPLFMAALAMLSVGGNCNPALDSVL